MQAATLLKMETAAATPHTQCVGLFPPLTDTPCSLTLLPIFKTHTDKNIRHTQTQQHGKDDLPRDNQALREAEREPQGPQ